MKSKRQDIATEVMNRVINEAFNSGKITTIPNVDNAVENDLINNLPDYFKIKLFSSRLEKLKPARDRANILNMFEELKTCILFVFLVFDLSIMRKIPEKSAGYNAILAEARDRINFDIEVLPNTYGHDYFIDIKSTKENFSQHIPVISYIDLIQLEAVIVNASDKLGAEYNTAYKALVFIDAAISDIKSKIKNDDYLNIRSYSKDNIDLVHMDYLNDFTDAMEVMVEFNYGLSEIVYNEEQINILDLQEASMRHAATIEYFKTLRIALLYIRSVVNHYLQDYFDKCQSTFLYQEVENIVETKLDDVIPNITKSDIPISQEKLAAYIDIHAVNMLIQNISVIEDLKSGLHASTTLGLFFKDLIHYLTYQINLLEQNKKPELLILDHKIRYAAPTPSRLKTPFPKETTLSPNSPVNSELIALQNKADLIGSSFDSVINNWKLLNTLQIENHNVCADQAGKIKKIETAINQELLIQLEKVKKILGNANFSLSEKLTKCDAVIKHMNTCAQAFQAKITAAQEHIERVLETDKKKKLLEQQKELNKLKTQKEIERREKKLEAQRKLKEINDQNLKIAFELSTVKVDTEKADDIAPSAPNVNEIPVNAEVKPADDEVKTDISAPAEVNAPAEVKPDISALAEVKPVITQIVIDTPPAQQIVPSFASNNNLLFAAKTAKAGLAEEDCDDHIVCAILAKSGAFDEDVEVVSARSILAFCGL